MSQLKYLYNNLFDLATLSPSSEVTQMPVENVQQDVLGTVWKTEEGWNIKTGFNDTFGFLANGGSTSTVIVSSGTYTGAGLATALQAGMRSSTSVGLTVTYNDTATNAFLFHKGATATSLSLYFNNYASSTIAVDIGFDPYTDYSGADGYSGTVSLSGQEWVQATIPSGTSTFFVIDNYNIPAGGTVLLRGATSTSSFSGLRGGSPELSSTITIVEDKTVYELPAAFSGLGVQIIFHNGTVDYTTIGRIWIGPDFAPAHRQDNVISWSKKNIARRSSKITAYGGSTYFDKKNPITIYSIPVEGLDPYYDATNKAAYEAMFDNVGDSKSFYTLLESDLTKVIYGFLLGNTQYTRLKNTPTIIVKSIEIQEQK